MGSPNPTDAGLKSYEQPAPAAETVADAPAPAPVAPATDAPAPEAPADEAKAE